MLSNQTRHLLTLVTAGLLWQMVGCATPGPQRIYIGTYTKGWACEKKACTSEGIYRADLDPVTGTLSTPVLAAQTVNPSYVAVHPNGKYLYAVNEIGAFKGAKTGSVSAFAITPAGDLQLVNQLPSQGADPCHISLTASGGHVMVANCSGGSIASYLVGADGQLKAGDAIKHRGKSVHPKQSAPRAHFIAEAPRRHGLVYVADLGTDQLRAYRIGEEGRLTENDPAFVKVDAGGGPRHLAFHPSKNIVYANNELTSAVTVLAVAPESGALTVLQTIKTTPDDFLEENDTAEIQASPDGRFVYVSNRGHNSIASFAVDAQTGTLAATGHTPTQGDTPRDFKIDPTGKFMLIAHQSSDDVMVFGIDKTTGRLAPLGKTIALSKPVSLAFVPVALPSALPSGSTPKPGAAQK